MLQCNGLNTTRRGERDSRGKKETCSLLAILVMSTLGFGADVISEGWT